MMTGRAAQGVCDRLTGQHRVGRIDRGMGGTGGGGKCCLDHRGGDAAEIPPRLPRDAIGAPAAMAHGIGGRAQDRGGVRQCLPADESGFQKAQIARVVDARDRRQTVVAGRFGSDASRTECRQQGVGPGWNLPVRAGVGRKREPVGIVRGVVGGNHDHASVPLSDLSALP
ncbi:hypothetical protein GALL_486000 [mine drainage metagenome]|uniref:Uncharacterized protein n=1 Tax=mine drainage metagenome TaxID=410659 RepID=A0A1J5Q1Q5_9ZZZZ